MHPITEFLTRHLKITGSFLYLLGGILGLLIAVPFFVLGVECVRDIFTLPGAPSLITTARLAEALQSQDRYWATLQNPQWDCSTLLDTTTGGNTSTEVFIRDDKSSVAILVTFTDPVTCAGLDPAQVTGVAYPMSERHIQNLTREGRLASFQGYHALIGFCTTCGRQNSIGLLIMAVIFVGIGLAFIFPLISWVWLWTGHREEYPQYSERGGWPGNDVEQFVPQVSVEDVDRILKRDYPADRHAAIMRMIDDAGQGDHPRVVLACLKNAGGNMERLESQFSDAGMDWRDVIAGAEYPNYRRKALVIDQLPAAEQQAIVDLDRSQYLEWLLRD